MADATAYHNGQWVPSTELHVSIEDLGFLMGATIVERMRTFSGKLFRLEDHLRRLRHSLEIVGWDADSICREVSHACHEFLLRNSQLASADDDWAVVVFVTPGRTIEAAEPTVCVHGNPLPFQNWAHAYESGVEAVLVDVRQVPAQSWPTELKCRSRMHYYLADRQASLRSPDAKAILLDQEGNVGEGTTANVVTFCKERGLVTPLRTKVLPGVSQQVLFELAETLGIEHSEDDILPEELAAADEVLFTSTSNCLVPIVRIDGKPLAQGTPGPVFRQLLDAWSKLVGVDITQQARHFAEVRAK